MKFFRRLIRIELILIYLVIIAGSVVRMTGSGMGCPDWPKCFGYLIPPTESSQLSWQPDRNFKEGQIIIKNETLLVAESDFTSGNSFSANNWEAYTKHNYALFNPLHTWVEYINRLLGALSGIPMFLIFVSSVFLVYYRRKWKILALSIAGLFMLGFEAWLGKLVVDGNLIPGSITIHMLGALIIIAILIILLLRSNDQYPTQVRVPRIFRNFTLLAVLLTLVQIAIGTQVREQVDVLNSSSVPRIEWIENLDWGFYVHRSFSLVILFLNIWLFRQNRKLGLNLKFMNAVLFLISLSILFGILLNYAEMPAIAQPIHLFLGTLLFGAQFYVLGKCFSLNRMPEARPV